MYEHFAISEIHSIVRVFCLNYNKLFTKTEPQLTMVLIARIFVATTILYIAGKLFLAVCKISSCFQFILSTPLLY